MIVFLNVKVFSYALISITYLCHYFQTEQVFKDFNDLAKEQDEEDWDQRGRGPVREPLDQDEDEPSSPTRAGLRSLRSSAKKPDVSVGNSEKTAKPTVVVINPPPTSEPGIINPLALNPSFLSGEGSGLGAFEADDDDEMPEVPANSFVSQSEAVAMVEAQESQAVKVAKRFTSESFRDLKESLLSSIAMCNKNNVSISFYVDIS